MSEPKPPAHDHVPDHVLEELLDAFSEESAPQYNFDDPSIDRLLGVTDEHPVVADDELDDDELDDDELEVVELDDDELEVEVVEPDVVDVPVAAPTASTRRVIVIPDDDRPDSVYLDHDKEQRFNERRDASDDSGDRSTIVIADLDDELGGGEPPVATSRGPSIDPRIRARRISVRRAESRRRLIWVAIGSAVVLVAVAAIALVASPLFDVRTVDVQGAVYTDADVLQSVIDDMLGEPVLLVDTEAAQRRLEAVPWVERASVRTDFPHGVFVDIRERVPVASFQGGDGRFRVIDAEGRVLDVIDNQPVDYLLLTGVHPDTARGQFAGGPYSAAAELVLSLPTELRVLTQSAGVDSTTGTLSLVLAGEGVADGGDSVLEVRLGDSSELSRKLARLLRQTRSGLDGVCALDVSTVVVGVVRC